ncbi:GNAT family N-acetyltransferase [Taklimakanibacter lacteus]|uniref:GNAT family N-acetyltransferase n=1 Tax=Taklimakanibacter lacteus TaxID=2268456 RepID=UPI000E662C79
MSGSDNPIFAGLAAKLVDARQALAGIKPGSRIYLGTGCAAPRSLITALETMEGGPADLEFVSFLTTLRSGGNVEASAPGRYRHRSFFVGSDIRDLMASGHLDYVPIAIDEVPALLANGRLPIDVAILQVSPPDERGFVSLGISVDLAPAVLAVARHVIAEVNPAMPRTHGASFVHIDRFAAFVGVDGPVTEYRHPPAGETADRVARYIAAIIEDGSTLQIGLGRVPNEALRYIKDRRDLGIHSDVITDGVVDLVEAGVVTGRRKTLDPDRIVTSYCLGTRRLYDFVDNNPLVSFQPIEEVCDPRTVAAHHRMVSITQAFAMDLTGQVCVDQFEGQFYGGLSTQAAFIRGAARSPGGKPIVCLASTTESGASRIKPLLGAGDGVGIARSDVHYVVTEYGIAYLFGKSIRERALAMIEVAHPDHREALVEAARQLGYVPREQYLASREAYPVQEERRVAIAGGEVLIRPAHAADVDALRALFHDLSPDDVYTRFFRRVRTLPYQDLQTLCNVNHESQVAFLAVTGPRENEAVIGSGCYFLNPATNLAEVAFMVAPEWQGKGVGTALQVRLQEYAAARGVRGFIAEILPGNERMVRLAASATGEATTTRDEDSLQVTVLFGEPGAAKVQESEATPTKAAAAKKPAKAAARKGKRSSK